ncbi:MAG: hypothetical protein GY927_12340 [bacterium]|nr:hypothetical protein [bacterium]
MIAWGIDSSSWDDAVDYASLEIFPTEPAPGAEFVMTTWHADETLHPVFSFWKKWALHPTLELNKVIIIHIARDAKKGNFIDKYLRAS